MSDNLLEMLPFLASAAGISAWMLIVSNTVRNWRESPDDQSPIAIWIRGLTSFALTLLVFAVDVSVPLAAYVVLNTVPVEVLESLQPHFAFAFILITAFLAQQGWFQVTKS